MSLFNNSTVVHRTKILPLRWLSNYISAIGSNYLVKAVYLDEDNNHGFRYSLYGKIWKIADFFYSRWGTYYQLDLESWKESMSGPEWDDYDSDGHAYWEYDWHEDPVTGDAWRLKGKSIFEKQIDFE